MVGHLKKKTKPKTPHNGGTIFEELDSLVKSTNTFPEYVGGRKEGKKEEKTEEGSCRKEGIKEGGKEDGREVISYPSVCVCVCMHMHAHAKVNCV